MQRSILRVVGISVFCLTMTHLSAGRAAGAPSLQSSPTPGVDCKPGEFPIKCPARADFNEAIAQFDLVKEINLRDRVARIHYSVLGPGGIVPQHSHRDRPCFEYILQGEATETKRYDDGRMVVKRVKEGEVELSTSDVTHWWKNETSTLVRIIAVDIFYEPRPTFWRASATPRSTFAPPAQPDKIRIDSLGEIDLATEYPNIPEAKDYIMRSRRMTLAPHQVTEVYTSKGRPAYTYVVRGNIVENRSDQEPSVRRPEEFIISDGDISYYWENPTSEPAVLWVVDFVKRDQR